MRIILLNLIIFFLILSCDKKDNSIEFKNFVEWWAYHKKYIKFYKDFEYQSADGNVISKKKCLELLKSGTFIPILVKQNGLSIYKLQILNNSEELIEIKRTIKQIADEEIYKLNWEGKNFPNFQFEDLSGVNYKNDLIKDKVVFLKTYFIRCQACNEEMKDLNIFALNHKSDKIIFLSLADDNSKDLNKYLKDKNYQYIFFSNQKLFIKNNLKTNSYPTHFIIKNGKVLKVVGSGAEMIDYVNSNNYLLELLNI